MFSIIPSVNPPSSTRLRYSLLSKEPAHNVHTWWLEAACNTTAARGTGNFNLHRLAQFIRVLSPWSTFRRSAVAARRLSSFCSGAAATRAIVPLAMADNEAFKDSWFTEKCTLWPGQGLSLQYDEILYQAKSDFQDVVVLSTKAYGTVLVLDGVIQATERDEFAYQEMIAHLPMCALEQPATKVLVVGGGDGGVLRELARYPHVKEVHMAEIDKMVPEVSKRFLPKMAVGFQDPRVQLHICDGIKFVQDAEEGSYDVIIVDSSDPVGPAEVLFQEPFFQALHRAVKPGGVVCTQAESVWVHLEIIKALASMCSKVFIGGSVSYAVTTIPTYPTGQIGMLLCCKARPSQGQGSGDGSPLDPRVPRQAVPTPGAEELRYYDSEVHASAFVLPKFARDALRPYLTFQK